MLNVNVNKSELHESMITMAKYINNSAFSDDNGKFWSKACASEFTATLKALDVIHEEIKTSDNPETTAKTHGLKIASLNGTLTSVYNTLKTKYNALLKRERKGTTDNTLKLASRYWKVQAQEMREEMLREENERKEMRKANKRNMIKQAHARITR